MCLAKTLTPSKRTEFRRLRHPMTSLSPATGNQSRPFFARCSGSFELHEALRYTIKDKATLRSIVPMKISGRRLSLTRTREGADYKRVKKALKKDIRRSVRRRLNREELA